MLPKYFNFISQPLDYLITSVGHEIGLTTEYPKSSLIKYEIKILKSKNAVTKSKSALHLSCWQSHTRGHILKNNSGRIRRAVTQHSLVDLMHDAIRLGMLTHAEMTAQLLGNFYVGSATDDAMSKYFDILGSTSQRSNIQLSNEQS